MFRRLPNQCGRIQQIVERLRVKGAMTPEKAMTSQELGLPPRFDEVMDRCLGQLGLFVKVGDKYYLSEERLKAVPERIASRRIGAP
jgi:hypothetical protein